MHKTPIQLLEQWIKEAEELFPWHIGGDDKIKNFNFSQSLLRETYIAGCKATHEKMLKLVELAYKDAFKEGKATQMWGYSNDNGDEDWQSFKTEHNL